MKYLLALIITVILGSYGAAKAVSEARSNFQKDSQHSAAKNKKKHRRNRRKSGHLSRLNERVPAGVTTILPSKRASLTPNASQENQPENQPENQNEERIASGSIPGLSETRYGTAIALPTETAPPFHAEVEFSAATISSPDAHLGNNTVGLMEIQPKLIWNFGKDTSIFGQIPFSSFSPDGASKISTIGRPNLGIFHMLTHSSDFILGGGISVQLPFFNVQGGDNTFVEPLRVWQVAPGGSWDLVMPDSSTHFSGTVKVAYETPSYFSPSAVTADGGMNPPVDSLVRPLTLATMVGVSHDLGDFTLGVAFHTSHWLGSGKLSFEGNTIREVSPLELTHGEVYFSWRFLQSSSLHLSATKGFKTRTDSAAYALFEDPLALANASVSLGLSQMF